MKIFNGLIKENINKTIKQITKKPIFRIAAEPGWKAVTYVVKDDNTIDFEYIDIKEWVSFNHLYLLDFDHIGPLALGVSDLFHIKNMQPVIVSEYNGKFSKYIDELKSIDGWNGTVPITNLLACFHESENLTDEEIKSRSLRMIQHMKSDYSLFKDEVTKLINQLTKTQDNSSESDLTIDVLKIPTDPSKLN